MKDLLAALAAAKAEMPDPKKNAANPHFKNKFADLGQVMDCIETPLANHGLIVTQTLADPAPGVLVTTLWHVESGQHLTSSLPLLPVKSDPQAQGSAITYARRYALKAMFGMVDVDDDGNAASARPVSKPAATKTYLADELVAMIDAAPDLAALDALVPKIKASKLQGVDHEKVREAFGERKAIFQEK